MTTVNYEIIRSNRRTLAIIVHRDGKVIVRAPQHVPDAEIERVVSDKAAWIFKKREAVAALPPLPAPALYVSGEAHLYLGQPYELQVQEHAQEGVTLANGHLLLRVKDPHNTERKKKLLDKWYRAQARMVFAERLEAVYPEAARQGIPYPRMKIRLMKTRWGSCSSRGNINLNLRLIQTPKACIDYVIMHELAHFGEPNHSRAYYDLLGRLMPEWQVRREELKRMPVR